MAAPPAQNEVGLSGRFHRDFQQVVITLEEQIDRLNSTAENGRSEAVDQCLAGIDRLSHDVKDASAYLPAYDQRTYSQRIKGLAEKLQTVRNTFNPPKKFSFKNRKNAQSVAKETTVNTQQPSATDHNTSSASTRDPEPSFHSDNTLTYASETPKPDSPNTIPSGPGIHRPSFPDASKIAITNHTNLHLVLPASASHATSSGTLSNLSHSVIDLSPASTASPFAAVYLKNISSSLILCGQVAGAVHITNVADSVLVITTRQFRMHGSRNVDVYLHAASRPIIEDCVDVRFAPLPGGFVGEGRENMWDCIDDFKWLKVEPSPNFRVLGVEERLGEEVWEKVRRAGEGEGEGAREETLRAVGVHL